MARERTAATKGLTRRERRIARGHARRITKALAEALRDEGGWQFVTIVAVPATEHEDDMVIESGGDHDFDDRRVVELLEAATRAMRDG